MQTLNERAIESQIAAAKRRVEHVRAALRAAEADLALQCGQHEAEDNVRFLTERLVEAVTQLRELEAEAESHKPAITQAERDAARARTEPRAISDSDHASRMAQEAAYSATSEPTL